jgi:hypothetical protein
MAHIEGRCLCGRVHYVADAAPKFVGICHCTDCQRFSGSAFTIFVGVPAAALTVTGTLKTFTKPGDSGKPIHRRFCPECGCSLMDQAEALPGLTMIFAGTLDDRSWIQPRSQIYCDSAQPWVHLAGEMKRFAKAPG